MARMVAALAARTAGTRARGLLAAGMGSARGEIRIGISAERFAPFLAMLPRDTEAGVALARQHDRRFEGRSFLDVERHRPLRHAIEIRHPTFVDAEFIDLLREHRVALVVADTAGRWPLLEDLTADFVYVRLHGDQELHASGYGDAALAHWARRIGVWARGGQVEDAQRVSPRDAPRRTRRDVFCYFDNDVKVHAPYDAARLAAQLGLPSGHGTAGRALA